MVNGQKLKEQERVSDQEQFVGQHRKVCYLRPQSTGMWARGSVWNVLSSSVA